MHGGRHASPPSLPFFSLPVVALWACSASGAPAPFSAGRPGHCVLLQPAPIHAGFRAEADSARGELFLGLVFLWPSSLLRIPEQLILRRSSIRQTQTPRHFYASPPIHLCCHPPMIDFPMICVQSIPLRHSSSSHDLCDGNPEAAGTAKHSSLPPVVAVIQLTVTRWEKPAAAARAGHTHDPARHRHHQHDDVSTPLLGASPRLPLAE